MSAAQTAANRCNAKRSTGPKTPEGKFRSSKNAEKHGIYSKEIVIDGESQEEWNAFLRDTVRYYNPCGPNETSLAEQIADLTWRQRRVARYESAASSHSQLLADKPAYRPDQREIVQSLLASTPPKSGPADPFEADERKQAIEILSQPPLDENQLVPHRVVALAMEACVKVLDKNGDFMLPDPRHPQFMQWANLEMRGCILATKWTAGYFRAAIEKQAIKALWPEPTMINYVIQQLKMEELAYDPAREASRLTHERAVQAEKNLKALPSDKEADKALRYRGMFGRELKLAEDRLRMLQLDRKAGRFDDDDDDFALENEVEIEPPEAPPYDPAKRSQTTPETTQSQPASEAQVQSSKASPSQEAIEERIVESALIAIQAAEEANPSEHIMKGPAKSPLHDRTIQSIKKGTWPLS
jgi:hypothetical protein